MIGLTIYGFYYADFFFFFALADSDFDEFHLLQCAVYAICIQKFCIENVNFIDVFFCLFVFSALSPNSIYFPGHDNKLHKLVLLRNHISMKRIFARFFSLDCIVRNRRTHTFMLTFRMNTGFKTGKHSQGFVIVLWAWINIYFIILKLHKYIQTSAGVKKKKRSHT